MKLFRRIYDMVLKHHRKGSQEEVRRYVHERREAELHIIEDARSGFLRFVRPDGDNIPQVQVELEWWASLTKGNAVRTLTLLSLLRDTLNVSLAIDGLPLWPTEKQVAIVIMFDGKPAIVYYYWGDGHVRVESRPSQTPAPSQPSPEREEGFITKPIVNRT